MRTSYSLGLAVLSFLTGAEALSKACRNVPGSPGYPTLAEWGAFNASISGRLVSVVPSAEWCQQRGGCTDAEWDSAVFRSANIPGSMNHYNFEQGYDLTPPSTCFRNGTTCGQGDVSLYSVEAETVADVQAAVTFASANNLRLVVKSSGHDTLGRSTAPNSLLVHMNKFNNATFTDSFMLGTRNMGSAATVGSGAHAADLYQLAKADGKVMLLATAATVCAAGGYVQGAGHSALGPKFGLAADNVLEFHVVIASGQLLQVNALTNPDLFWSLRGGGSGSWGVVISATFRTFPSFASTGGFFTIAAANNTVAAGLMQLHAHHIFDFDATRSAQYFYLQKASTDPAAGSVLTLFTLLVNQTSEQAQGIMAPFMNAALALPGITLLSSEYVFADTNDLLFMQDDAAGMNLVGGSRLIPTSTYKNDPQVVGPTYQQLLDGGAQNILGHLVAGGQVEANAKISSAVHPAWRTAKTHVIVASEWPDSTPLDQVSEIRNAFHTWQLPILENMSGPNAGSYSNEADNMETHFQTTFFGPNYAKLSAIKLKYDPKDLFIVPLGVGSERWDEQGICRR
ncbi:FAD-binding domain-containing protein [Mycena amicta]|nr:FAD-binding domain-containing protein [Mycena amicta]